MTMFTRILIANRGEIAVRVIKTARRMGIETVAVYSAADAGAMHVRMADQAVYIGEAAAAKSYLVIDAIIKAAKDTGAQAIHPGYGFLSENAGFAERCAAEGIVFIGPSAAAINAMGLKDRAKEIMGKAGVPIVPGYMGDNQDPAFLQKQADEIGYPVLIKAVAGGGGKGMRLVERSEDFTENLASCQREAASSFGNAHVLIEKYISKPRHIEVQVFGDTHGQAVYLFERDCSLQRRHQKVVEEAPAPDMPDSMRRKMGEAAVKAAKAIHYAGAGTIEFIVDSSQGLRDDGFYFMEMNTRLQVEHPVTEAITGQDLVEWQLRVAAGEALPIAQDDLSINGHAFEVRLYAEDPAHNFLPQIGSLSEFFCDDPFVRLDTGVEAGDAISIHYDPMIAKLIVHGHDRAEAIARMRAALNRTMVAGLVTNQEFLAHIFAHPDFIAGDVDTGFIPRHLAALVPHDYALPRAVDCALALAVLLMPKQSNAAASPLAPQDPWSGGDYWRMSGAVNRFVTLKDRDGAAVELAVTLTGHGMAFDYDGEGVTAALDGSPCHAAHGSLVRLRMNGALVEGFVACEQGGRIVVVHGGRVVRFAMVDYGSAADDGAGAGRIVSPMPGRIVSLLVKQREKVAKGQPLLVMEAMKMEVTIRAGCDGIIDNLPVAAGDQVEDGALLVSIEQAEA